MGPEHGSGRHEVEALERIRVSGLLEWDGGSDFEAEALGMGSVMIFLLYVVVWEPRTACTSLEYMRFLRDRLMKKCMLYEALGPPPSQGSRPWATYFPTQPSVLQNYQQHM
jgi:hypothetical protein